MIDHYQCLQLSLGMIAVRVQHDCELLSVREYANMTELLSVPPTVVYELIYGWLSHRLYNDGC